MLLWSFDEVARQLGGVSVRTVRRLVEAGELPACRVGRLVRIPPDAVRDYVSRMTGEAHNRPRTESVTWKGKQPCHTDAKIRRIGGSNTPTQAAKQLTNLLAQMTGKKQTHSKQSAGMKSISNVSGASNLSILSKT
jgi:excisionase family DNA binding protein